MRPRNHAATALSAGLFILAMLRPCSAITWDFVSAGSSEGWIGRSTLASGETSTYLRPLRSEALDSCWAVYPTPYQDDVRPAVELISPRLYHDAALFDRVTVEFRVLQPSPSVGRIGLEWTTDSTGQMDYWSPDTTRWVYVDHVYSSDWQTVQFADLRPRAITHMGEDGSYESVLGWDGLLADIRLVLDLTEKTAAQVGPEDIPDAIEIRRIVLTGAEEQLAGELDPPAAGGLAFGAYFATPFFCPLVDGLGTPEAGQEGLVASLGDLDGDGDLDLVAYWETRHTSHGWVSAYNDGTGRFSHPVHPLDATLANADKLALVDMDQDGEVELMAARYPEVRIAAPASEAEWEVKEYVNGVRVMGIGDADGDGHRDVFCVEQYTEEGKVLLSRAGKMQAVVMPRDPLPEGHAPIWFAETVSPTGADGMLWRPPWTEMLPGPNGDMSYGRGPFRAYMVQYFDADLAVHQQDVRIEARTNDFLRIADVDRDGRTDMLVCAEGPFPTGYSLGVLCLHNLGDSSESVPWLPDVRLRIGEIPVLVDLDGDGIDDVVVGDTDLRQPAVVVSLGQEGTVEVLAEGRYPLDGSGGQVLAGDVNGDSRVDLVVLEPEHYDTGGVHVLLNQASMPTTAIAETGTATPDAAAVSLGGYPNPFNPQTTVRLSVHQTMAAARVVVHNALGQRVRTLRNGALEAGVHLLPWDGCDDAGHDLPSGIYVVQLEGDGWSVTHKITKLQ